MDAPARWRRPGSGGSGVRRPGTTPAPRTGTNSSKTSLFTTHPRATSSGAQRASNQAVERSVTGRKSASSKPEATPSRWREMRQSVRTKATMQTIESRPVNAKIADLCPEDREKVAKLVRRIVEVGTLHEEGEKEFQRQKEVMEGEVVELREQVRQDVKEIEELTEELRSTRRKAQLFEERVEVLEESVDAETRARLEAEQTLDLLKLEVDKLRALVQRQQGEMQRKTEEQQQRFDAEIQQVNEELKEVQERLLKERNERLLDKQKALDQRLERSVTTDHEKLDKLHSLFVLQQQEMQFKAEQEQEETKLKAREQQERHESEMLQLKQELKAAQELLHQEREGHKKSIEKAESVDKATSTSTNPNEVTAAPPQAAAPIQQVATSGVDRRTASFATNMQGDLAMFEEVKDLYAEDLFASRRWGGILGAANAAPVTPQPAPTAAESWQLFSAEPSNNTSLPLGPALSAQELFVQQAIERDVEDLLRSEALHILDTLHQI